MAINIGPKIGIDGEKEYRDSMKKIVEQAKTLTAEMKMVAASFDESTSATKKAESTSQILTKQIEVQKERVSALSDMLKKAADRFGEDEIETLKWKQAVYGAQTELSKMESELKKSNAELEDTKDSAGTASTAFGKLKESFSLLANAGKANKVIIAEMKAEYGAARSNVASLTKELVTTAAEQGENSDAAKELAAKLKDARNEFADMAQKLKTAKSESKGLASAFKYVASDGVSPLAKALQVTLKGATVTGEKALNALKNTASGVMGALKSVVSTSAKVFAGMGAAAAGGILALGKIGVDYNAEMEQYTTNFETMLGSTEEAEKKVASLKELAAKTPFEMAGLAQATQQLLAMNVASQDTDKYLRQLGDISLGDQGKLDSLVNAFGKMSSTGKVTLEYINMMAEQGFNPLNEIAKQTGESMEQLYDRVSKGTVSFDEIKMAMESATSQGGQFYNGMEKASQTMKGQFSTLKDNARALVGEIFKPISEALTNDLLPGAVDAVNTLTEAFRTDGISGMIAAAGDIVADTLSAFSASLPEFLDMAASMVSSLGNGIRDNLPAIQNKAKDIISTLSTSVGKMLPDIVVTGVLLIGQLVAGIIKSLPQIIATAGQVVREIVAGFAQNWGQILNIGRDIVQGIIDGIASAWNVLVNWFNDLWNSLFGKRSIDVNVNKTATSRMIDGSHEKGLSYVPFNGYIAQLHKGEMVLTRAQADLMRKTEYMDLPTGTVKRPTAEQKPNVQYNFGGVTFQIYQQPGEDENSLVDRIMDRMQTKVMQKEAALVG